PSSQRATGVDAVMTAVAEERREAGANEPGRVVRVIGPVVDVEFGPDALPEIHDALTVEVSLNDNTATLTLEVAQHIGDNTVRAISMQPTDGLVRGAEVTATGSPITVPVGDATLGHVFNVLGRPLDVSEDEVHAETRWPIHRAAPSFDNLEPRTQI